MTVSDRGADPNHLPPASGGLSAAADPEDNRMRTILQVLPALVTGGVERGTVDMARAIVQTGWRSVVVSRGGPMVHELDRVGATHIELPVHSKNPTRWRATFDALVNVIDREGVDLVHARSRMPAWLAWRAARRAKLPFVTTFHGRYPDSFPLKRLYNSVMARGDRVIAISEFVSREVSRRFGVGADRLRVIPRGIDLDQFDPDRVSAERMIKLADQWALPDGAEVVMILGRVTRWKGHRLLIDAIQRLADRDDMFCLVVGASEEGSGFRAELDRTIAEMGLQGKVRFVGECRDLPAAYKLADVVVSASLDPEPFGRTIVEAQAMGRPVVATRHGGAAETVVEGETGWLSEPGDPNAMAAAIRNALDLPAEARERVFQASIENARQHYGWALMCERTLSVYDELFAEQTAPRK